VVQGTNFGHEDVAHSGVGLIRKASNASTRIPALSSQLGLDFAPYADHSPLPIARHRSGCVGFGLDFDMGRLKPISVTGTILA